jgi:RNA 2',3'-cyclic 3'-phosphodiesterase
MTALRVFIAIPLPGDCQAMLDRMQLHLRQCAAEVRWISGPSIHLTLKFLGEIDPSIIPRLAESLRDVSKSEQSLSLQLHGLGAFPNLKNPRVIWCGIHGDLEELGRLQKKVEKVCADSGFPPEERSFQPHLTLGRVKGKRNIQSLMDCIKIGSDLESSFRADQFNIYRSVLNPQGAVYSILESISLGDRS